MTRRRKSGWCFPRRLRGNRGFHNNDAVEQALCFGWIYSIVKSLDEDSSVQRFTPRKNQNNFSQPNIERLRYLDSKGRLMPSVARAVKPELKKKFVFPEDIMNELKKSPPGYKFFKACSPVYQRIRVAYVEAGRSRPEEFKRRLDNFIEACAQKKQLGFGGIDKHY